MCKRGEVAENIMLETRESMNYLSVCGRDGNVETIPETLHRFVISVSG